MTAYGITVVPAETTTRDCPVWGWRLLEEVTEKALKDTRAALAIVSQHEQILRDEPEIVNVLARGRALKMRESQLAVVWEILRGRL